MLRENSLGTDQLAKPADLNHHCFQNNVLQNFEKLTVLNSGLTRWNMVQSLFVLVLYAQVKIFSVMLEAKALVQLHICHNVQARLSLHRFLMR